MFKKDTNFLLTQGNVYFISKRQNFSIKSGMTLSSFYYRIIFFFFIFMLILIVMSFYFLYSLSQEALTRVDILTHEIMKLNEELISLKIQLAQKASESAIKAEFGKVNFLKMSFSQELIVYMTITLAVVCAIVALYYGFHNVYGYLSKNFLFKYLATLNVRLLDLVQASKIEQPTVSYSEMHDATSGCIIRMVFRESDGFLPGIYAKRLDVGAFQPLSDFLVESQSGVATDFSERIFVFTEKTGESINNFFDLGLI